MTADQKMYFKMFQAVVAVSTGTANNAIVSTSAGYMIGLGKLQTVIANISLADGIQGGNTTGPTKDRQELYADLAEEYFVITSGAAGYGDSIDSNTLYDKFNKTKSMVLDFGFEGIGAKCDQLILDIGGSLATPLIDWGVTSTVVTTFVTTLAEYRAEYNNPRQAIVTRETQTQEVLPQYFVDGRKILKRSMDKAAITLKKANPVWNSNYDFSRELITIHHEITTIKGFVSNSATGMGIPKPSLTSAEHAIHDTGDLNGSYVMLHFVPGDTTILCEAPGFHPKTIPMFHVSPGEIVHLNIVLDPL